jgi:hypothetical protein
VIASMRRDLDFLERAALGDEGMTSPGSRQ